jgi:hypothetical protein
MHSKAAAARTLMVLLVAVPVVHAEEGGAFGPEIAGLRLGMSPEQARSAILARAKVTPDEVWKVAEVTPRVAQGKATAEDHALQARFFEAHPGFTIQERKQAEYTRACRAEALAGRSDPAYQPSEHCPRPPAGSNFGLAEVDPRRSELVGSLSATLLEGKVTSSYQVTFTTEPGRQKVLRIQFWQRYPAGGSDSRPTLRTLMESLAERFGKPLHCVPPQARGYKAVAHNAEVDSRKMGDWQACYWQPAGTTKGALPARVDPSIAYTSCTESRAFPSLSLPVGFTLKDAEGGGQPKSPPGKFSTVAVCGDAIVKVPAVTDDPAYGDVLLDQLELDARWLRAELDDQARVERVGRAERDADQRAREDEIEAKRKANKNKPKF